MSQDRHVREKQKTAEVREVSPVCGKVELSWREGGVENLTKADFLFSYANFRP